MSQIRRHLLLTVYGLMLLLSAGQALAQAPADHLLKQRMTIKIDNVTFTTVLGTLSVEHRIPIGLELSSISYDGNRQSIEVNNEKLEQILDLVCQLWPAYRWEVTDGVINFVPAHGRDLLLEQLLTTKIRHFSPEKGINSFELRDAILDLPEVKKFLDANDVSVFRLGYPTRSSGKIGAVELSASATDVKGLLNKIIRESARRFWVISRRLQDGNTIYMSL